MARQIKGFITCDSYINNETGVVSPLYELSSIGSTYAKVKQQYYSTQNSLYSLFVFKQIENDGLNQTEVNAIINVVKEFVSYATSNRIVTKQQLIITFMANYNTMNPGMPVSDVVVSGLIDLGSIVGPDFISFKVGGILCSIWIHDLSFRGFYPDYDIDIVLPFAEFPQVVANGSAMIEYLGNFDLVGFNGRIETAKANNPTTTVKILNIPYRLPNSTVFRNCYFAFNQWGAHGNFDYVLKLKLYEYLLSLGLTSEYIESIFPSILKINEFFVTPRWDRVALPSQVGQTGILSQVSKAFEETFDLGKYIKVYSDLSFLKSNSYNVPYDYNNVLLTISNGFYTDEEVQDFRVVYDDIVSVTSSHPDFARMSSKTQRFLTLLESMLQICDSNTAIEMFTKIVENDSYVFTMVGRQGVWYLAFFFEGHQYYMIPKYEYMAQS